MGSILLYLATGCLSGHKNEGKSYMVKGELELTTPMHKRDRTPA